MEQIRKKMYFLLTGMTVSAVLLLTAAAETVKHEKSTAAVREASLRPQPSPGFVLKEYEGRMALYRENAPRPYRILDREVWLLPEEDRLALQEGILVATEQELRQLLEDWDG